MIKRKILAFGSYLKFIKKTFPVKISKAIFLKIKFHFFICETI